MLWFLLIAVCILLITSGVYVFIVACLRKKELPWLDHNKLKDTPAGEYYPYIQEAHKWLIEHNAEDIYIYSKDHLKLHALWVPAEHARGTVLFAHGYRSTALLDFCAAFSLYHQRGLNLLIPDQRAHGKSEGKYITFGVKESDDMRCWIDYHNQNLGQVPMLLSGISMGATTMLYLSDAYLPDNICGIVADCGFTSPKDIISSVFLNVVHLPAGPSVFVANILAYICAGFSFYQRDTRKALSASKYPVLLIHGTEDGFVPCQMTQENYSSCNHIKHILLVEGADHGLSFLVAPERYLKAVDAFLESYLYKERGEKI